MHLAGPDVTAVFITTTHKNTLYVTLLRITAIFLHTKFHIYSLSLYPVPVRRVNDTSSLLH